MHACNVKLWIKWSDCCAVVCQIWTSTAPGATASSSSTSSRSTWRPSRSSAGNFTWWIWPGARRCFTTHESVCTCGKEQSLMRSHSWLKLCFHARILMQVFGYYTKDVHKIHMHMKSRHAHKLQCKIDWINSGPISSRTVSDAVLLIMYCLNQSLSSKSFDIINCLTRLSPEQQCNVIAFHLRAQDTKHLLCRKRKVTWLYYFTLCTSFPENYDFVLLNTLDGIYSQMFYAIFQYFCIYEMSNFGWKQLMKCTCCAQYAYCKNSMSSMLV